MAKFKLGAGVDVEMLTQEELRAELEAAERRARQPYEAESYQRIPLITGQAVGGVLSMGGDVNPEQSPAMGYVWSVRHLVIEGLNRGATPDAVQIFRNQRVIWELNGNQYAQTWGRGEIMLQPGETLAYKNIGTFNATGQIIVHGAAWQVPAQLAAELVS